MVSDRETPQPPRREQVRQFHPVYTLWTTRTVWTTGERDARRKKKKKKGEEIMEKEKDEG